MPGTKLELTRPGKNKSFELEPRILIEKPELSYGDKDTENMLIHGDNLLALKALEQQYMGKIKCIYIDPPYNTGSAFTYYDDGLEHTEWLNLMRPRLELLKNLLSEDGLIFVQIDDNEQAYLTVMMDEIFGRNNRVNIISVKMSEASGVKMAHVDKRLPKKKEFILLYKKSNDGLLNPIKISKEENLDKYLKYYSKIIENIEDPVEDWIITDLIKYMKSKGLSTSDDDIKQYKIDNADRMVYRTNNKGFDKLKIDKDITEITSSTGIKYIRREGKQMLFLSDYISEYLCDLWTDISTINLNKEGGVEFNQSKKPEKLVERVITLGTSPGDIVLDSFLGSGTTAAVAHKMGRKWIGIELGDHAYSHCKVRLDSVIDGEGGGISKIYDWQGGGGYKFYELGPSVLLQDKYGNYIINPNFNSSELVQAICKIENFTYKAYEDSVKHGYSTEKDFIHVTTRHITQEIIKDIQENSLKEGETMLIVAKTFESNLDLPSNIQIKKIPTEILDKCEYNKDNYSLPISKEEITDED